MITLTTEQAQQIEEALVKIADLRNLGKIQPEVIAFETLYVIRAARAQKQAEQPVSQEYQDHLVNQSFDWAAMAAKHQFMEGYRIGLAEMREKCAVICEAKQSYSAMHANTEFAAVIRSINFEGDTGFRPVSEMIAEHKQDPKKAAAIEKAKMRKAERDPVTKRLQQQVDYWINHYDRKSPADMELLQKDVAKFAEDAFAASGKPIAEQEPVAWGRVFDGDIIDCICPEEHALNEGDYTIPLYTAPQPVKQEPVGQWDGKHYAVFGDRVAPDYCNIPLYAAPVQQVDLTDDEIDNIAGFKRGRGMTDFARAVIAAYKEKNK